MKRCFLIGFLLMGVLAFAQPTLKLYGYSQITTPGTIRVDIPENGGQQTKAPLFFTNYYIFIGTASSITIQPKEIWVEGKWRKVSSLEVVITPFISGPKKEVLVPSTKLKVRQLNTGDTLSNVKPSAALIKMMKNNELIISYIWKGKKYYAALKKLTVLEKIHGV
jgi:hypothetical protein